MAGTRITNTDSRTLFLESGPVLAGAEGDATTAEVSVLWAHLDVATEPAAEPPAPAPPPAPRPAPAAKKPSATKT
jgi:hypothetical protein